MMIRVFIGATVAILATVIIFPQPSHAQSAIKDPCTAIESVFARGSGRELSEKEAEAFDKSLAKYATGANITPTNYELGTEHIYDTADAKRTGYRYPAVPINGWKNGGFQNAAGAWISSGGANDYGKSVNDGIKELVLYLNQRFDQDGQCKQSRIILAGYSQGAQVMSQTIVDHSSKIKQHIRDRIDYVALLGDPKLYLPEGQTPFLGTPPACRQSTEREYRISAWRETVPSCKTEAGALGARNPYVTTEFATRIGTWCNKQDPVCDNHYNVLNSDHGGHERYVTDNRVDEAVKRSLFWVSGHLGDAQRIQLQYAIRNDGTKIDNSEAETISLPYTPPSHIDLWGSQGYYDPPCTGYVAVDKYQPYTLNVTSTAVTEHPRFKAFILAGLLLDEGCSVQIYAYDSLAPAFTFQPVGTPSHDRYDVERAIMKVPLNLIPDTQYASRCRYGQNESSSLAFMRDIVIGNSPSPTTYRVYALDGTTRLCTFSAEVHRELQNYYIAVDPYHKVESWGVSGSVLHIRIPSLFPTIATNDLTAQQHAVGMKSAPSLRSLSTNSPHSLPPGDFSLSFAMDTYYTEPGESITLSVKPSNPAVSLDEYKLFVWDFNNDGTTDTVTMGAEASYTYSHAYSGPVQVTALTVDDDILTTSTSVVVQSNVASLFTTLDRPGVPQQLALHKQSANSLDVTWTPADTKADTWIIQINDSPGTRVRIDDHKVTIGDLDLTQPITIRVQGVTTEGYTGKAALIGWLPDGTTTTNDEYAAAGRGYDADINKNHSSDSTLQNPASQQPNNTGVEASASTAPTAPSSTHKPLSVSNILPPPKDWRAPTLAIGAGVVIITSGAILYRVIRRRKLK